MAHSLAITEQESSIYNNWGTLAEDRLESWMQERDDMYMTTSEALAFCEMMRQLGIQVVFRIWRRIKNKLTQLESVPDIQQGHDGKFIVFDLLHSGKIDTNLAHWSLLKSGSATDHIKKRNRMCR